MTCLSTIPYAYEPGPIARLLGVVLEALTLTVQGYCVYEESCIIPTDPINKSRVYYLSTLAGAINRSASAPEMAKTTWCKRMQRDLLYMC